MPAPWPLAAVSLVVTRACNLRCTYCYQAAKPPGRMRWSTARAAIEHLWMSTSPSRRLVLTGGEPLLAYRLVERVVLLARSGDPLGRPIDVTLMTNGTRLGEAHAAFLASHQVSVQISLDGPPPAQALRGAWTFPRLDALLDALRQRHRAWFRRHVSVAVMVPPANIPWLADSVEYLLAKGVGSIVIAPPMGVPGGWHDGLRRLLDEQFARLFRTSVAHYQKTGRVPVVLFQKAAAPPFPRSQAMCGIARGAKIAVDADGEVYGCAPAVASFQHNPPAMLRDATSAMHLGHVTDRQLAARLPAYRAAMLATGLFGPRSQLHSSYGECRSCRFRGRCVVCPLAIAHAPGGTDPTRVPDFACAFNRAALKYQARFPRQVASAAGPRAAASQ